MHSRLLAEQRTAELERVAEQARLLSELPSGRTRATRAAEGSHHHAQATGFTLRAHHLAKLDRFLGQAQRAALRAQREFEGVTIEISDDGLVTVHAIGMTSILL
jgi:hypothetical protein